ncbi:MAG: DUF4340 domain-containing protein [Akkermansiaceae bacterium]|nr:DUF4340 domain-containing protein [Akkermansiaceae bacterium]
MRSLGFTIILALLAILTCGLSGWKWIAGNFDSLLGAPPIPVGNTIYTSFTPDQVKHIQVSQNGINAEFELTEKGWQTIMPWKDRMDPRAAVSLIKFTLGLRVEDYAKVDDIDARAAGLKEGNVSIRLEDQKQETLAKYRLGRRAPWLATVKDINEPVPTIFTQPRDANRKDYIYACTGDITAMFKDNLKYLRDHRPFYFNPVTLKKIRIRTQEGEFTLGRETPESPWRVIKPLDLPTDPKAMKSLLEGLYELQTAEVSDRSSVTLPANGAIEKSQQIALTPFGTETETILDTFPPETPDSRDVKAIVSDRPNTVFSIPYKPEPNLVSITDLPLTINDLRDSKISNLNIKSLTGILIQPSTSPEILISRAPKKTWVTTIQGETAEANEERLFTLLKAVTESRVLGFETDAATDFKPWGLDRPFLKLRFLGQENQGLQLAFGLSTKGEFFANREGSPTVTKVDPALIASIPVLPYEWRLARLWSIDKHALKAIARKVNNESPLTLLYEDSSETWTAIRDSENVTASLDVARANYMLKELEGLKVTRWLSPNDDTATKALLNPSLVIKIFENETDEFDDVVGQSTREAFFAPQGTNPNPAYYYGRLGSEKNPFLLDRETYQKIAIELFLKE